MAKHRDKFGAWVKYPGKPKECDHNPDSLECNSKRNWKDLAMCSRCKYLKAKIGRDPYAV